MRSDITLHFTFADFLNAENINLDANIVEPPTCDFSAEPPVIIQAVWFICDLQAGDMTAWVISNRVVLVRWKFRQTHMSTEKNPKVSIYWKKTFKAR